MKDRREILFLAHRIPYPPDKGDKIRSWRLLKYLTESFDVHLAAFVDDNSDFRHEEFLRKICASVALVPLYPAWAKVRSGKAFLSGKAQSVEYFRDARMARKISDLRRRPLAAEIVFSSTMAQFIEHPVAGRPRLIDFCDADSAKFSDYANDAKFPMRQIYERESRRLAMAETKIANWADASFAITPEEALLFNRRADLHRPLDWWSNGVDTDYFDPDLPFSTVSDPCDVVFTGAMDYRANIDAALHFASKIWPIVRASAPSAEFAIVGARPAPALKALDGKHGIVVTGRVEAVRPWIKQSKLAVAPLRIARGVQNKVLEAMAMAAPVVASREAASGIKAVAGEDLIVADDPEAFAAEILNLLNDSSLRARIGLAARKRVRENYNWDDQLSRFSARLNKLLSDSTGSSAV